jgi:argininosuccinate lyase
MAKLYASNNDGSHELDPIVEKFCFANDIILDERLIKYDVIGSLAHAAMLKKIGVLDNNELSSLSKKIKNTYQSFLKGKWRIEVADEDVHTAIENRLGNVGKKLHTARSRNDQVLTDMRLYSKEKLLHVIDLCHQLALSLAKNAKKYEFIPMPGYTHLQRAMPSSYGMWLSSFAENILDNITECKNAFDMIDQSPLGSGAGYGVSLDIDREFSAKKMGFAKVQKNSIYCQNSRGYIESVTLSALTSIMSACSRLSSDICLYCSQEFNFLKLPGQYFTGSSIMPQKKNPDLFELIRAKLTTVNTLTSNVRLVSHGLTSGYSKDLQEIKEPVLKAFDETINTLEVLNLVMPELSPNKEILENSLSPELFAADEAYKMVKKGIPFRTAYQIVKKNLDKLSADNADECIKNMKHIGATGNLQLIQLQKEITASRKHMNKISTKLQNTWNSLLK